jgi:formate/nitrite transporter
VNAPVAPPPQGPVYSFDAFSPREIAERIETAGVAKARLPLMPMTMLGMCAGAFIGLGALAATMVLSDASLGFAAQRLVAGLVFSLGLVLVSVAGAELFTGNNLLAMAWADGRLGAGEVLRNWAIVCAANLVGAVALAALVALSGHAGMNGGAVGATAVKIAAAKCGLDPFTAFVRGVLCNLLVCMAVWMAMAGRSVVDKVVAIVPPVMLFVAAGFEHSIANMYFIPLAMMLTAATPDLAALPGAEAITLAGFLRNLAPVILGNLIGGSVLVALVYFLIYRRKAA